MSNAWSLNASLCHHAIPGSFCNTQRNIRLIINNCFVIFHSWRNMRRTSPSPMMKQSLGKRPSAVPMLRPQLQLLALNDVASQTQGMWNKTKDCFWVFAIFVDISISLAAKVSFDGVLDWIVTCSGVCVSMVSISMVLFFWRQHVRRVCIWNAWWKFQSKEEFHPFLPQVKL